ncbi:DUF1837 domain-containing protein [Ensifer sp. ENS05]|uniref:HamA C-terminal domain-containing protein n=1 Tax=Ensifer sp. ENS05 TaxID=2769277 RepID=UPI001FEE600D|nr:DUF1837 domain-containing protein [Ensifer sp. ENS05]
MEELTDALSHFVVSFALPRSQVSQLMDLYGIMDREDFIQRYDQLSEKARNLFKKANEATNRNGEAGELLLYLLTEWVLAAPQLIAKMSLKTNREMPVHGADGIHARFCPDTQRLLLYWGESKLYSDVSAAITSAVTSIVEALRPEKLKHEIDLVQRHVEFAGLDGAAKEALLRYLDPFEENYNERHDVITCLVGFDFEAFSALSATDPQGAETAFNALAVAKLSDLAPSISAKLRDSGLIGRPIELFLFPMPSVQKFRDLFQAKIGWKT